MQASRRTGAAIGGLALIGLAALPTAAQDAPDYLSLSAGAFDYTDDDRSAEGRLEVRSGRRIFSGEFGDRFGGVGPMLGLMVNTDGGLFGYGGLYAELRLLDRLVLWPTAGLGGYREGDGKDLGGAFQFHLGITAAYRFEDESQLGVSFAHVSNAGVHDSNPGANSLMLTYSLPLNTIF